METGKTGIIRLITLPVDGIVTYHFRDKIPLVVQVRATKRHRRGSCFLAGNIINADPHTGSAGFENVAGRKQTSHPDKYD
jgi:hypothetical protein